MSVFKLHRLHPVNPPSADGALIGVAVCSRSPGRRSVRGAHENCQGRGSTHFKLQPPTAGPRVFESQEGRTRKQESTKPEREEQPSPNFDLGLGSSSVGGGEAMCGVAKEASVLTQASALLWLTVVSVPVGPGGLMRKLETRRKKKEKERQKKTRAETPADLAGWSLSVLVTQSPFVLIPHF